MKKIYTLLTAMIFAASSFAQNATDYLKNGYEGYVKISIATEDGTSTTPEIPAAVTIEKTSDELMNLTLKNFVLYTDDGDPMPVGNITLQQITVSEMDCPQTVGFENNQDVIITEGDAEALAACGGAMWVGPILSNPEVGGNPIPVELVGIASPTGMDIDININLTALGQMVHVDFVSGDYKAAGINDTVIENATNNTFYSLTGQQVTNCMKGIVIANGKKFINK